MKWVFGMLLVLNVGLYLWATGHRQSGASIRPTINFQGMRLIGERGRGADPGADDVCYRIGPFADRQESAKAITLLTDLSVRFSELTVSKREVRAYRVYLGPFTDPEQTARQRGMLHDNGISDYYIKRDSVGEEVISLGLFSQRRAAENFVRSLAETGIIAKHRAEDRILGPTYWLELTGLHTTADALRGLRDGRWEGDRARLRAFPCG